MRPLNFRATQNKDMSQMRKRQKKHVLKGILERLEGFLKVQRNKKREKDLMFGAQGGTRTRTLANYPLKVACLPISPPGQRLI